MNQTMHAMHTPFAAAMRQFAQSALQANALAFQGFEHIVKVQLKSAESSLNSSLAFLSEAADVSDLDAAKAIWPKGAALVKDSTEKFYATSQEVLNQTLKTSEAIGQLFREQFQTASQNLGQAAVQAAARAGKA